MHFIIALALAAAASTTYAVGLGAPIGTPLLGKPLHLDIPLTGHSGAPPGSECFSLAPTAEAGDELYFPRAARAYGETRQGKRMVVVVAPTITQPVVQFRLSIGCGFGFARDFLLLTDLPTLEAPATEDAPAQLISAPQLPTDVAPRPRTAPVAVEVQRLPQDTTLEALARDRYPSQPKAREKFKRMMHAANSEMIRAGERSDSQLLPRGTELIIPMGLPERRRGPYAEPTRMKPATPQTSTSPSGATPAAAPPSLDAGAKRKAPKDRLIVGADAALPMKAAEIGGLLDRLIVVSAEHAKAEEELTERIARVQGAFAEVKQYALQMEARLRELEEARKEAERKSEVAQTWQVLVAILLGGILGAGILHVYPRLAPRKETDVAGTSQEARAPADLPQRAKEKDASDTTSPSGSTTLNVPPQASAEAKPRLPSNALKGEQAKTETASSQTPRTLDFDFTTWSEDEKGTASAALAPPSPPPKDVAPGSP